MVEENSENSYRSKEGVTEELYYLYDITRQMHRRSLSSLIDGHQGFLVVKRMYENVSAKSIL
jgi:hypothetical protein